MKKTNDKNTSTKSNKKTKGEKTRVVAMMILAATITVGAVVVSGFEKKQIDSEIRHLKDEASMCKYNTMYVQSKSFLS